MNNKEQLDQINKAIGAIENGAQEYRIGSRMVRKPDLTVLYKERIRLQQQYDLENSSATPGVFVASFDRR